MTKMIGRRITRVEQCLQACPPWAKARRLKQVEACSSRPERCQAGFGRLPPVSARRFRARPSGQSLWGNAWWGLFVLSLLFFPALTHAENLGPGGGTRIIVGDDVVGPYRLLFTASPEPAQAGQVTFVVRVSDPQSDEKVRDAEVALELTNPETGLKLAGAVTHANSGNPIDYAAHVMIEQPGQWNGTLRVRGPAGTAEVPFMQRVLPKRQLSILIAVGLPFLVILGLLGGLWFARSGARQRKQL
jgi:hypothetical protein